MKNYLINRCKTLLAFPKQNGAVLISVITAMISVLMILAIGNGMATSLANQLKPASEGKLQILYAGNQGLHSYDSAAIKDIKGVKSVKLTSFSNTADGNGVFANREIQPTIGNTHDFNKIKTVGSTSALQANSVWINRQAAWLMPNEKGHLANQTIYLNGKKYQVTGAFETNLLDGGNLPDILMTANTFKQTGLQIPANELMIKFSLPRGQSLNQFETEILTQLRLKAPAAQNGQFTVLDNTLLSDSMHKLVKNISTFVVAISSMSLVVSGLSILNNSYANIAMRSPEIALRRVRGASKKSIRNQFLVESMILLCCGVIIGSILSEGIILILNLFKVKTALSFLQFIVVGAVPVLIGMLASVGPANFAGAKNITDLLRTDYN